MNSDQMMKDILLSAKTVASVGLSSNPAKESFGIVAYLKGQGYRIIPVNPGHARILDEPSHPRLASIPAEQPIDIVNLFRRSEVVGSHVDEAIARGGVRAIWMQIGIADEAAARRAVAAGILVVMDRCLMVDWRRLGPT